MILKKIHYIISFLLVLLSILLTILVPGGPVETRDFSHYSETVLALFNIFLTILGLLSFIVAFLVAKRKKYSIVLSALFALLYILVYLFDLLKIFPTSPVTMPSTLFLIEVISTFIGFILIYLCVKYNNLEAKNNENITIKFSFYKIVSTLIVLLFAIGIVIFATKSAMG
ncbi:LPXTG cell wall anchor domain-containing protein [Halarcobacter ebronensis]|uniref:LPXTG cell wall anchor domain-containing protein n=1 Tax=Halarcobacter ebronensis TaxID=1462615 RepID=UPI00155DA3E8|nr:LPXTG cell wall anchor domain-containing protein [Halarcobacter ebronensis]QKF81841.1 putative membrane protein [Halarcobacter ebronensis]